MTQEKHEAKEQNAQKGQPMDPKVGPQYMPIRQRGDIPLTHISCTTKVRVKDIES